MSLFSWPKISVNVPPVVFAGQRVVAEVVLEHDDECKVDHIEAYIRGHEGPHLHPNLAVRLAESAVIPRGVTTLPMAFDLPPDMAPTHALGYHDNGLSITVEIAYGAVTQKHEHELRVRLPPPPHVPRTPAAFGHLGRRPEDRRLEVAVASTHLVVGETLTGTFALYHADASLPLALVIELRASNSLGPTVTEVVSIPRDKLGTTLPFELKIPELVPPSYRATSHALTWQLCANVEWSGAAPVFIPVALFDPPPAIEPLPSPPLLTHERSLAALAQTGDTRIQHVHRGREGTFLVSTVATPSFGLGLDVDREHTRSRDPRQAAPVLDAVMQAARGFPALGFPVRWTDRELVLERPIVGIEAAELAVMVQQLDALTEIINRAHGLVRPPVQVDVGAWCDLARDWQGTLCFGDLSLDGVLDQGVPVHLALQFDDDGQPVALDVAVGDEELSASWPVADALDAHWVRGQVMALHARLVPEQGPYR